MIVERHSGIRIEYNEHSNKWEVDDSEHGVTLTAQGLADAKKRIDLALKKAGKGRFERFFAWRSGAGWSGGDKYTKVQITSVVEGGAEAWVSFGGENRERRQREKAYLDRLYEDTTGNAAKIVEINDKVKERDEMDKVISNLKEELTKVSLKEE